jgi:hypothetical protein
LLAPKIYRFDRPHRVREIRCEVHCANGHTYSIVDADCAVASLREAPSKGEQLLACIVTSGV